MSVELESVQRSSGALFAPFGSVRLPARFGDPHAEWTAVRRRCGLLDPRFRTLLRVVGADRVSFLQGMVSNDVAQLADGQGTYAALLTQQGKLVSDLRIYALADELWLDVPEARAGAVRENLQRYIVADDVEFVDAVSWVPLVLVEGPLAARTLVAVTGESLEDLQPFAHREVGFDGTRVRVVSATHSGENGYMLCGDGAVSGTLWDHCRAAGAEPVGMEALNVLRVEAGIPWQGWDMDETTLVAEVGLEAAISYKKGCYLGQEVVERVAARGQVHRKLVGVVCEGRVPPAPRAQLTHEGREVGWVTTAVWSPAIEAVIALGYLRRESWEPGTEVQVAVADGYVAARVTSLPFYVRESPV